jgi:cutinase
MKSCTVSAVLLAALAAAAPSPQSSSASCKKYTLLFARGTTETGTLGTVVGPGLEKAVDSALGADQMTVTVSPENLDLAVVEENIGY